MKKNVKLLTAMALLTLGVTSCKKDYFDENAYQNLISEAFVVDDVDARHDWRTVGTGLVQATVYGDAGETYTVKVYDGNPLGDLPVTLFCTGQVESGGTFTGNFSFPLTRSNYYVAAFDSKNHCIVQSAALQDGALKVTLGQAPASASKRMKASESDYSGSYAKTVGDYLNPVFTKVNSWDWFPEVKQIALADMTGPQYTEFTDADLASNNTLTNAVRQEWNATTNQTDNYYLHDGDGHHFRVAAGTEIRSLFHTNGSRDYVNDVVIYVEGTVHLNGNTLNGATVVVANGGKLLIEGTTNITNNGRFIVLSGGEIKGNDGATLTVTNSGWCYNAGTIKWKGDLNTNGSDFYNCGTIEVNTLDNQASGKITNFGTIRCTTNKGASNSYNCTIVNACYMQFTGDAGIGTLTLLDHSRLDVGGMAEFGQQDNYLNAYSLLNCGSIWANNTRFYGPENTSDFAIIKTGKIFYAGAFLVNQNNSSWSSVDMGNNNWAYVAAKLDNRGTIYMDWDRNELYNTDKVTKIESTGNNSGNWWVIEASGFSYVSEATAPDNITIPAGDCTGTGYNDGGNPGNQQVKETSFAARFCFEDNFPMEGDYDFNDAVFTLSPRIKGDTVWLTVSLDAVGAQKQLAAALRINGVRKDDVRSITRTGNFDLSGVTRPVGSATIIDSQDNLLPDNLNSSGSLVINLFNDAHYVMGMQAAAEGKGTWQDNNGNVRRWYYNTVERDNAYEFKVNDVTPVSVTYQLLMASTAAAASFTINNLDPFIVEQYNGGYWEVHTVSYKTQQVLTPYLKDLTRYADNKPWAIQVAETADFHFRYPIEWTAIGYYKNNLLSGAYKESGHSFGQWAVDRTQSTDWYHYPTSGLVY